MRPNFHDLVGLVRELEAGPAEYEPIPASGLEQIHAMVKHPARQLATWLSIRVPNHTQERANFGAGERQLTVMLWLAGLLGGWGAAATVFYFDGSGRVNVLLVLAVLVGLPLVMLAISWLSVLLEQLGRRLALFAYLGEGLKVFHVGRWLSGLTRVLPVALRQLFSETPWGASARQWQLLLWSQHLGLAFQLGALLCATALVVFTDLAFGWSTTLSLSASSWHHMVVKIATPWASWLPQAVPDLALIEATRYFRIEGSQVSPGTAQLYGGWWPFVLTAVVFYGLVPRVVSVWLVSWCTRRAVFRAMLAVPGSRALLARLNRAQLSTRATEAEARVPKADGLPGGTFEPVDLRPASVDPTYTTDDLPGDAIFINWAGAPTDHADFVERLGDKRIFQAGGAQSLARDRETVEQVVDSGPGAVVVVVKAWEPPLLELYDFLSELRRGLGSETVLFLLPISLHNGAPTPPDLSQAQAGRNADRPELDSASDLPEGREQWARAVRESKVSRVHVIELAPSRLHSP